MINYLLLVNFCMTKGMAATKLSHDRLLRGIAASMYGKAVLFLLGLSFPFIILSRGLVPKWIVLFIGGGLTYFLTVFLEKRIVSAIEQRGIYKQYKQLSFWQRFGYATLGWLAYPFLVAWMFFIALYFDDILGW